MNNKIKESADWKNFNIPLFDNLKINWKNIAVKLFKHYSNPLKTDWCESIVNLPENFILIQKQTKKNKIYFYVKYILYYKLNIFFLFNILK